MLVKLIIIEPKYQVNLGYIARTAMNFGVEKLFIVNPRAKLRGEKAKMYAKHAYKLLEQARVYRSLGEATKDCDLLIGTTGIREKSKANFNRIFFAEDAVAKMKRLKGNGKVGLLIGRDDIGLRNDEIEKCDMLAYISTNPEYPVLNVSHALAIFLYLIKREGLRTLHESGMRSETAGNKEMQTLFALFKKIAEGKKMRNRKAVLSVFRRIIRNTQPSKQELHALITALK
jgi:TrmH family RNA methyltransferase